MGTLAEILTEDLAPRGRCKFRDWRESFATEDQAVLDAAMDDNSINDTELTRRLRKAGCPVTHHRVVDHRRKQCKVCQ